MFKVLVSNNQLASRVARAFNDAQVTLIASQGKLDRASLDSYDFALVQWESKTGATLVSDIRSVTSKLLVFAVCDVLDPSVVAVTEAVGANDCLNGAFTARELRETIDAAHANLLNSTTSATLKQLQGCDWLIGESKAHKKSVLSLANAINSKLPVLILGETGTGKGLFARAIHQFTDPDKPFKDVNIGSLDDQLAQSELFGHVKGAFTDASTDKVGLMEEVADGTLFIDEIGECSHKIQTKLLNATDRGGIFRRVGDTRKMNFVARLICATHRDLDAEVRDKRFRADLRMRLFGQVIHVPPLRERGADKWLLCDHFLAESGKKLNRAAKEVLENYSFPGNVRQLELTLEAAAIRANGAVITPHDLQAEDLCEPGALNDSQYAWPESILDMPYRKALAEIQKEFVRVYLPRVLASCGGRKSQAAEKAGYGEWRSLEEQWNRSGLPPLNDRPGSNS